MAPIQIQTRGNSDIQLIEDEKIVTVMDLKRKLNEKDPASILLTFKGKILMDSTPLSTLGEDILFTVEKDIEFAHIEPKSTEKKAYRTIGNNQVLLLRDDEIIFKDGRPFIATKRTKKLKFKEIVEFCRKNVSRVQAIQFLFIMFVLLSRHYPLLATILTINFLRMVSFVILRSKAWESLDGHLLYSVFMFLASLLAIDHDKFIKKAV